MSANRYLTGGLLLALGLSLTPSGPALAQSDTVVLYTAHRGSIVEAMIPRFEAATGLTAEVVKAGSGDLIRRALAERDNPQADVIWSIGAEQLEANNDILEAYTPAEYDMVDPVFKVGTNWLPYTGIVMVFVANTEKLDSSEIPRTWQDLADPALDGMVSSSRADSSGSAYMQLATVLNIYKDDGWDVYEGIFENLALSDSSSAVPRFVSDGEALVGVTLEDNAYQYVLGGANVEIIYPEDGTTAAPDGIALVKGGPNPDNGKVFIDWALSQETQEFLVQEMGRRPVRVDVAASGDLPPLSEIEVVPYDFGWSASNKDEFVARWTELLMSR